MARKKRKHRQPKDLDSMIQEFLRDSDKKFEQEIKSNKKYRRKGSRKDISNKGEDE